MPTALADGLPRVIYLAKYKDHAVGAAVIERIMPTTPATIRAAAKTAGCGNPATEPCHVIRYVYVDSFARKRGVASQLVRHCVDSLRKEGSSLCVAVAHEDEAKEVAGALTVNGFSPLEMRETRKDKAAHLRIFISHYPELAPNWAIMDPIHLQIQYMREFFKRV